MVEARLLFRQLPLQPNAQTGFCTRGGIRRVHNARQSGLPGIDQPAEVPAGPSWVPSVSGVIELVIAQSGSGQESQWGFTARGFGCQEELHPSPGRALRTTEKSTGRHACFEFALHNPGRNEKAAEKQSAPDSKSHGTPVKQPSPKCCSMTTLRFRTLPENGTNGLCAWH